MPTLITEPYRIVPAKERAAEYPMKHAVPIAFGYGDNPQSFKYHSGTATLANFGEGPLAITCEHVIKALQELKQANTSKKPFQLFLSAALIDINRPIIMSNAKLDIATISLTASEAVAISKSHHLYGTRQVNHIYSGPIQVGDMIAFTGFPGQPEWRYKKENNHVAFHSLSTSLATVKAATDEYLICQMDELPPGIRPDNEPDEFNNPGGLSGGPAFLVKQDGPSFFHLFVGILYEAVFMAGDYLILRIRRLICLNNDGTLKKEYIENS